MMKVFCDQCGKELDAENMKYVGLSINDYEDNEHDIEHWDFCHDCAASIKHRILRNFFEYKKEQ